MATIAAVSGSQVHTHATTNVSVPKTVKDPDRVTLNLTLTVAHLHRALAGPENRRQLPGADQGPRRMQSQPRLRRHCSARVPVLHRISPRKASHRIGKQSLVKYNKEQSSYRTTCVASNSWSTAKATTAPDRTSIMKISCTMTIDTCNVPHGRVVSIRKHCWLR